MPGGMRGETGNRIVFTAPCTGMPPKGDFRLLPGKGCDTMPVPEKWPSG